MLIRTREKCDFSGKMAKLAKFRGFLILGSENAVPH